MKFLYFKQLDLSQPPQKFRNVISAYSYRKWYRCPIIKGVELVCLPIDFLSNISSILQDILI